MRLWTKLGAQCAGNYENCADDLPDEKLFVEKYK